MSLIMQKNNTHKIIQQMDFHQFKEEMLDFCKKLCTFDAPFLHKVHFHMSSVKHLVCDQYINIKLFICWSNTCVYVYHVLLYVCTRLQNRPLIKDLNIKITWQLLTKMNLGRPLLPSMHHGMFSPL